VRRSGRDEPATRPPLGMGGAHRPQPLYVLLYGLCGPTRQNQKSEQNRDRSGYWQTHRVPLAPPPQKAWQRDRMDSDIASGRRKGIMGRVSKGGVVGRGRRLADRSCFCCLTSRGPRQTTARPSLVSFIGSCLGRIVAPWILAQALRGFQVADGRIQLQQAKGGDSSSPEAIGIVPAGDVLRSEWIISRTGGMC